MEFKVWKDEGNASFRANDLESAYTAYSKSMEMLSASLSELSTCEDDEDDIIEIGREHGREIDLDDVESLQRTKKASAQLYDKHKELAAIYCNRALVQLKVMEKGNGEDDEDSGKSAIESDISLHSCAEDCRSALSALEKATIHAPAVLSEERPEQELSKLRVKAKFRLSTALGKHALRRKEDDFSACKQICGDAVATAKEAFQEDPTNKAILDWIEHMSNEIAYLEGKTAANHAISHLRANRVRPKEDSLEYRKLLVQQEALSCFSAAIQTSAPPDMCLKIGCEAAMDSYKEYMEGTLEEGDRACDVVAECAVSFSIGSTAVPAGLKLSAVAVSSIVFDCLRCRDMSFEESLQACAVCAAAVALHQCPNDRVKASRDVERAIKKVGGSDDLAAKLAGVYVKQEPSTRSFIASKCFDGKMDGYVFKTGEQGLGYYLDRGLVVETPSDELELDRDDPMFAGMDDEKYNAMRNILNMTDFEVEQLPLEHQETVTMFRQMYKDRVKMKNNPDLSSEDNEKKETKEKPKNPNEWLEKVHSYMQSSDEKRKDFDLEKWEQQENERLRILNDKKKKEDMLRKERVDKEAQELFGSSSSKKVSSKKKSVKKKKSDAKEIKKNRKKNLDLIFNYGNVNKSSSLDNDMKT